MKAEDVERLHDATLGEVGPLFEELEPEEQEQAIAFARACEQHGIERLRAAADDLRGSLAVSDHDPYEELAPDDKHCLICEAGARYDTATSALDAEIEKENEDG